MPESKNIWEEGGKLRPKDPPQPLVGRQASWEPALEADKGTLTRCA